LSSGFSIIRERRWVGYHEAFDVGSGRRRTPSPSVGVPTWHGAADLRALEVGHLASRGRMVRTTAKAA